MIDTIDAKSMCKSGRELISLAHDTKKLSQILIFVSMDITLSDNEEADLTAECDFQK